MLRKQDLEEQLDKAASRLKRARSEKSINGWSGYVKALDWVLTTQFDGDNETIAGSGIVPDVRLVVDFVNDTIGYQYDVYIDGRHYYTECRDFGGDYPRDTPAYDKLTSDLLKRVKAAIDEWRLKH